MATLALYRRWRPQTFADVLGQKHVTQTLQAAIREGKVAHAYLFAGPRGTGKTSTARILAKALNCENGPTAEPDNTCEACRSITAGSSLDVIEIDAATHGGVDDVRELRDNALLAPAAARKKIYIVDEAHMITTAGWNAFLKTVEEPPPHVAFVFATTEPHKVLPTIASRCQRFDFRRVSSEAIAAHLAKVCADEGVQCDDGALHLIARHAEGGVRDALSALDQMASGGAITVAAAAALLGSATGDILFEFADALAARDTGAAIGVIARVVEDGRDLRTFCRQVLEHLRSLFLVRHVETAGDLLDATDEVRAHIGSQAERFGAAQLAHLMRVFIEAQTEMRQQTSPRLALELATMRATVPEAEDSAAAALARVERLERLLEVGGAPQAAPSPSEPPPERQKPEGKPAEPAAKEPAPKKRGRRKAAPEPEPAAPEAAPEAAPDLLDLDKIRRQWPVVLEEVRKSSRRIHSLLGEATPHAYGKGTLTLEFGFKFHADQIAEPRNSATVAEAVGAVFGVRPRIAAVVGERTADDAAAEPAATLDPVEALREGLGAELVEEED